MQANPSAPFVHPLSLALPCPVMTIITGEWLQRRDRQRASRAIGGWKPPYRVSPRSSMRADCHMLLLARQSAFPLLHTSSILRWRTFFVVWVTETWRSVSWGEHKKSSGRKLPKPYRGHTTGISASRYRDTFSSEWTATFSSSSLFIFQFILRGMSVLCDGTWRPFTCVTWDRCNIVKLFSVSFMIRYLNQ